jgi:hypothetical protein
MLNEKMMEDAIIANPEKYIEAGLTLISRQYRIGSYVFDLLFKDRHGAKLIVELQRGTLDRNHTYKILDYYDEYKSRNPDQFVELMIIANKIPRERRERLSSFGIDFKEIPNREFADLRIGIENRPQIESQVNDELPSPSSKGGMPRPGDIFSGKLHNLGMRDRSGWQKREISFSKYEISSQVSYDYPRKGDEIVLIDTGQTRYELKFSKPENERTVCLGTVGRLKSWYQKKGFDFADVKGETVYFEYTGNSNEFLLFTTEEYGVKIGTISTESTC